ncbi:MAG: hypothetical protein ACI4WG_05570 [Erysipelotrichaceae bacterium]
MKFENEVTVELACDIKTIEHILLENGFSSKERFLLSDRYLIHKSDLGISDDLKLLNHCLLLRSCNGEKKLTYKYKEYDSLQQIVKQGKSECLIGDIDDCLEVLQSVGFVALIEIVDTMTVYSNGIDELALQQVNDKHLYIEIEEKCKHINKQYQSIEEIKAVIRKYNIPIKNDDFFAKKALIELQQSKRP